MENQQSHVTDDYVRVKYIYNEMNKYPQVTYFVVIETILIWALLLNN